MRLWNSGFSELEIINRGGCQTIYNELFATYGCKSIPLHVLHGLKRTESYSCNFHNPPEALQLREIISKHNESI